MFAYSTGVTGSLLVVAAVELRCVPLLFVGTFLFGGASAANLQSRYAAVDLADSDRRARHLSLVVWATTLGAVVGPNLAPFADRVTHAVGRAGVRGAVPVQRGGVRGRGGGVVRAAAAGSAADGATCCVGISDVSKKSPSWGSAFEAIRASAGARLGVSAVAVGHVVMVGVMSMTPVHIGGYVHVHGDLLRIVGLVISIHITGMYALSPVIGWATDRFGRRPVILAGVVLLALACALSGTAGDDTVRLAIGMGLLGVGWGCTMVAGSTLLSESVPVVQRSGVQGLSDVIMGVSAAHGGRARGGRGRSVRVRHVVGTGGRSPWCRWPLWHCGRS